MEHDPIALHRRGTAVPSRQHEHYPLIRDIRTLHGALQKRTGEEHALRTALDEKLRLLWEAVRGLVRRAIRRCLKGRIPMGMTWEDLESEGAIAFLHAVRGYDEERGAFSTYLCAVVEKKIRDVLLAGRGVIYIPPKALREAAQARRQCTVSPPEHPDGQGSGSPEIRAEESARITQALRVFSASQPHTGDDDGRGMDAVLRDTREAQPDVAAAKRETLARIIALLPSLADAVHPMAAEMLCQRFGMDGTGAFTGKPRSYTEIGQHRGVSPERVRQIVEKALRRLREWLRESWNA